MIKLRGLIELPRLEAVEVCDSRNTPDVDFFWSEDAWRKTDNFYLPSIIASQGLDLSFEDVRINIENYAHAINATHYRFVYSDSYGELSVKDSDSVFRYMKVWLFKKNKVMIDTVETNS